MKKVIYFASSYQIGLTALLTEKACSLIKKSRMNFLFISGENEQMPGLFDKLDSHRANYAKITGLDYHRRFPVLVKAFSEYVDHFKPDVVHVQTNWQLAIVAVVKFALRKEFHIVYTIWAYRHNYKFRPIIAKWIMSTFLNIFAKKVVFLSSFMKKEFRFLRRKSDMLFLGVDNSFFENYYPIKLSKIKRMIFPGEFREGKNQDLLIRCIKRYIDITGDSEVELCLPGSGDKLEYCKSLTRKLGLEKNVIFPGFLFRNEMFDHYLRSQFAIIPTNAETFGLCIAEPFALGRVVLSRRVGVAEDIIIHQKTGFLFNTEKELLDTLLEIFTDYDKCLFVSQNAFKAGDIFRWDNICDRYIEIINGL